MATTHRRSARDPRPGLGQYLDAGAVPDAQGRVPAGTVHGFLWHRGEFTTIDVPGAPLTQPLGINDDGDIVGAYLEAEVDPDAYYDTGRLRGFVLRDGKFTPVDFPGGDGTRSRASTTAATWSATTTPPRHGGRSSSRTAHSPRSIRRARLRRCRAASTTTAGSSARISTPTGSTDVGSSGNAAATPTSSPPAIAPTASPSRSTTRATSSSPLTAPTIGNPRSLRQTNHARSVRGNQPHRARSRGQNEGYRWSSPVTASLATITSVDLTISKTRSPGARSRSVAESLVIAAVSGWPSPSTAPMVDITSP